MNKFILRAIISIIAFQAASQSLVAAELSFDTSKKKIAKYIVERCELKEKKKVVILPFNSLDQKNAEIGGIISEDILIEVVGFDKVSVVERSQIDKIMSELEFNQSGAIDAEQAKKIGRGLGADAIIIGNYSEKKGNANPNPLKLNIKITDPETFEILGAMQIEVKNEWKEKENRPASQSYTDSSSSYSSPRPSRSSGNWSFFDWGIQAGFAMIEDPMTLVLDDYLFSTATISNIKQQFDVPPILMKSNIWSSQFFGMAMDIGYMVSRFSNQTVYSTGSAPIPSVITFNESNTYKISTIMFNFSFLFRIPISTDFFPYLSVTYPMSLAWIESTGLYDPLLINGATSFGLGGFDLMTDQPFDIFKMFSYSVGIQWNIVKDLGIVAEYQIMNTAPFNAFGSPYNVGINATSHHMINVAVLLRL